MNASSIFLVESGYTLFEVVALCLFGGFVGLLVAAGIDRTPRMDMPEFFGVVLPTIHQWRRMLIGSIVGGSLGFAWGAPELNSVDRLICNPDGLQIESRLSSRLITRNENFFIRLIQVDIRGRDRIRVMFESHEFNNVLTVKLSERNASRAKDFSYNCLNSEFVPSGRFQ